MYIFKNALNNVRRSKGRSALFAAIVFIIALSACLALSIRESAETTKESGLAELAITGNITLDMDKVTSGSSSSDSAPSKSEMKANMQSSSLSLTELKKYSKLESVKSFYYTSSLSVDSSDVDAVTSTDQGGNKGGMAESSGDFTVTGYSSDEAMTAFTSGTSKIFSGSMFTEGTSSYNCVISTTLAKYNDLSVGSSITFTDPDDSDKTFSVKIVGLYKTSTSTASSSSSTGGGMPGQTTANNIYMSYNAVKAISNSTDITMNTQGTYTFSSYSNYKKFSSEAHKAGLASKYTIESQDINNYEKRLTPLTNLSKYAKYFLIIVVIIGGVVLTILTVFNIRDRKYEIGVLAAIGMSKKKIAKQFIYEIAMISLIAILAGGIIGSLTSVPVTNALLPSTSSSTTEDNFSRGGTPPSDNSSSSNSSSSTSDSSSTATASSSSSSSSTSSSSSSDSSSGKEMFGAPASQYISSVTSAANFKVIVELLGVGMVLVFFSGGVAVASIMRYDPLAILTNRD